jgi:hypothetical protein
MNEPDLEKFKAELLELENAEPAPLELPPLAAVAIISHIQLAIRHPSVNSSEGLTPIAIDVACQLQELFNPNSAVYEVLKLGWDVEHDRPSSSKELCSEPCPDFLQNLGCRCTNYKIAEAVSGENDIPPEVLARGVAIMEETKRRLAKQGFKAVNTDELFND